MKYFFNDFKQEFLLPDETNFSELLHRMDQLHEKIVSQTAANVPRVPLAQPFRYKASIGPMPEKGQATDKVFTTIAHAFQGSIRWHQPTALMNVAPAPLLDGVAVAAIATLYNNNTLWDYVSGSITRLEKQVVAFLSQLAGWDAHTAGGLSVAGGKATLLSALRCGLNTCDRESVEAGLSGEYVVLASKNAHYSLEDCCNYLGIGRANVVRIGVDTDGRMVPAAFEQVLQRCIIEGKKVAAIVALGGDTLHHSVDPIRAICNIRDRVAAEHRLSYIPHLHVDSVNAWLGLVFGAYDFDSNKLGIEPRPLQKIQILAARIAEITLADSFAADFHKTGLAPYMSSFFIIKSADQLYSVHKPRLHKQPDYRYGEVHTHHFSLDNSRSSQGILTAWTSIERLGVEGFQRYWAQLITISERMRQQVAMIEDIVHLNVTALGNPLVIQLLPPGETTPFEQLAEGSAALETYRTYCFAFYDYMSSQLLSENRPYPLLGFVPSYLYEASGVRRPAFLIYSNQTQLTELQCDQLVSDIVALKHAFERQWMVGGVSRAKQFEHLPK